MNNLHPNYDCSEIAEDLYYAAGNKGNIINITSEAQINVIENGNVMKYDYHQVYTDGRYIYDPRYSNSPISNDKYLEMLKEVNSGKINIEFLK